MVTVEPREPIDLRQFRAGRQWRAWGRNWQVTRCNVDDNPAGTTVSVELHEASPLAGAEPVEGNGPFYCGRHAWTIIDTQWNPDGDGHGLRVFLQRTKEYDRPHPVVAAIRRVRLLFLGGIEQHARHDGSQI